MEHPNFPFMLLQLPKQSVLITNLLCVATSEVKFPFLHTKMILLAECQM